jgi:hypothetical protein
MPLVSRRIVRTVIARQENVRNLVPADLFAEYRERVNFLVLLRSTAKRSTLVELTFFNRALVALDELAIGVNAA